jgi:V/A-type H+-transporting ATPase subunit I
MRKAQKEPFVLLYVFSLGTISWGLITGNWFGVENLARLTFLDRFIIPELYSYADNQAFMIHLCFVLGAIHLTIAHTLRALQHLPSSRALGEMGWIMIMWFLYFVAGHLVLGRPFYASSIYLAIGGVVLVGFFSGSRGGFLKSSLLGFADLPLNIIRSFSDLVSYLRLFAVGYATLVVALSFNKMALGLGGDPMVKAIGAAFILLFGHALNILMAFMAVLVHGIRLNMLEFSGHVGMTWAGRRYQPFKKGEEEGSAVLSQ